jgi:hypothetical protein
LNRGQELSFGQMVEEDAFGDEEMIEIWILTPDEKLCPICAPMARKQREIGKTFKDAKGPPAHITCRCTTGLRSKELIEELERVDRLTEDYNPTDILPEEIQADINRNPAAAKTAQDSFEQRIKNLREESGIIVINAKPKPWSTTGKGNPSPDYLNWDPNSDSGRYWIAATNTNLMVLERMSRTLDIKGIRRKNGLIGSTTTVHFDYGENTGALGWYNNDGSFSLNMYGEQYQSWWSLERYSMRHGPDKDGSIGFHSTGRTEHTANHEFGHLLHDEGSKTHSKYRENAHFYKKEENWNEFIRNNKVEVNGKVQTAYDKNAFDDINYVLPYKHGSIQVPRGIKKEVSKYAASDPNEMVAEMWAGMADGKKYSKQAMDWYKAANGPEPPVFLKAGTTTKTKSTTKKPDKKDEVKAEKPAPPTPEPGPDPKKDKKKKRKSKSGIDLSDQTIIDKVLKLKGDGLSYRAIDKAMGWPPSNGNRSYRVWKKWGDG